MVPALKFQIINHFIENPELRQNQTQLAKSIQEPAVSVGRCIPDLVKLRVLHEERQGRAVIYSLNRKSALVAYFLTQIVKLNANYIPGWVSDRVKTLPLNVRKSLDRIILFGSAVRGELNVSSDIDLLAVIKRGSKRVETDLRDVLVVKGNEAGLAINLHVEPTERFQSLDAVDYLRTAKEEGVTIWRK